MSNQLFFNVYANFNSWQDSTDVSHNLELDMDRNSKIDFFVKVLKKLSRVNGTDFTLYVSETPNVEGEHDANGNFIDIFCGAHNAIAEGTLRKGIFGLFSNIREIATQMADKYHRNYVVKAVA